MVMRVTKEQIKDMKELRKKGMSYSNISLKLQIGEQTVMYHLCDKYRDKLKEINKKRYKPRDRKKYMREYQKKRYGLDPNFREKQKEASRKNWRKKHGK